MAQHLLIPIDGSTPARKAFEYVLEQHPESHLTLLSVIDPVGSMGYTDDEYFDLEGFKREEERRRESTRQRLEEFREQATEHGFETDTVIELGRPARRILQQAEALDVDHIVMGSHGRSGAGRVLFGSVAEMVARRSPVPVTIVR